MDTRFCKISEIMTNSQHILTAWHPMMPTITRAIVRIIVEFVRQRATQRRTYSRDRWLLGKAVVRVNSVNDLVKTLLSTLWFPRHVLLIPLHLQLGAHASVFECFPNYIVGVPSLVHHETKTLVKCQGQPLEHGLSWCFCHVIYINIWLQRC